MQTCDGGTKAIDGGRHSKVHDIRQDLDSGLPPASTAANGFAKHRLVSGAMKQSLLPRIGTCAPGLWHHGSLPKCLGSPTAMADCKPQLWPPRLTVSP
eukprot:s1324_g8.t1